MCNQIVDRNVYGTKEFGGLVDGPAYHAQFEGAKTVYWTDPELKYVTRLRLISDPGYPAWDVSYCHGILHDGTKVRVELPFDQLSKFRMKRDIVTYAIRDGVHAAKLGVLGAISTLC